MTLNLSLAPPAHPRPRPPVPRSPYLDLLGHLTKTPPGQRPPRECPPLQRRGNLGRPPLQKENKDPIRKRLWDTEDTENKENIPPTTQGPYAVELPTIGPVETPVTVTLTVTFL
nr:MAG: E4 protein [Neophocaena asiaeorientalis asiaeorientalis papillomavirus 1]